jgi:hypothetical protein
MKCGRRGCTSVDSSEVYRWRLREVMDSGQLFTRACEFDILLESSQSNRIHAITAIAIGVALKLLLTDAEQGVASALLK